MNVRKPWLRSLFGLIAGVALGYGYYYFIGCKSGTCAITGNPINSILYGGALGLLWTWPAKSTSKDSS